MKALFLLVAFALGVFVATSVIHYFDAYISNCGVQETILTWPYAPQIHSARYSHDAD